MRAIMDALSPTQPAQRVVFMKAAQVGATEAGNCFIGFVMHHAPGPMQFITGTWTGVGVDGNGQTELAEVISGLRAPSHGEIFLDGKAVEGSDPRHMRELAKRGIAQLQRPEP